MNEVDVKSDSEGVNGSLERSDDRLLQKAEFAALCSFIHHFGTDLGIYLTFPQLEQFLRLEKSANWKNWETLHIKLLNKLKYRARPERWEPVLGRFLLNHAQNIDSLEQAGECLVTGVCPKSSQTSSAPVTRPFSPVYYDLESSVRTRLLLVLLESQFDRNQGFKDKVNLRSALDLRFRPLGYDVWGRVYWLLKDSEINLLLYREDSVKESFQLICQTTDEMRSVRTQLENACPASTKLSDILATRGSATTSDPNVGPASPSITTELLSLVREGIASTEVEMQTPKPPLTNGNVCEELVPSTSPTRSPIPVVQNEPEKLANANSPPLSDIKPEALQSVEEKPSSPITPKNIEPDEAMPEDVGIKCDPAAMPLSESPNLKLNQGSTDDDKKPLDQVKLENTDTAKEESVERETEVQTKKPRKRGRIPKSAANGTTGSATESTPLVEVRRSGRMRKPVEFLTMEAPQPKRPRHSVKPQSPAMAEPDDPDARPAKKHRSRRSKITSVGDQSENKENKEEKKQRRRKKRKRRHGKKKTKSNPWLDPSSSSESDAEDDTFERALLEHEQSDDDSSDDLTKTNAATDWLDQPESDFNPDDELTDESDVDSLTRGRNFARQKRLERMRAAAAERLNSNPDSDETCQVCGKSHMPEWILLCDRCDRGHHAMCLCPPLFFIPEGDWFCPRCQHAALLQALAECADQIDAEQKKQTIWRRMQERLNFVNISMTNILANDDEEEEGRLAARRRARRDANLVYRDSESSQDYDDIEEGDENDRSARNSRSGSQYTSSGGSDSDSRDGFRRRTVPRRRAAKQARLANGSSSRRRGRKTTARSKWLSDSEEEDESRSDSSSRSAFSPQPAPRTARQRPVQYDLGEAFKQLDEALEEDEKYQEEKRRRRNRKLTRLAPGSGDSAIDASPNQRSSESGLPPGRSRGKDLSNILGPDWKDDLDLAPPSRLRSRKRHRVSGALSSSSTESDPDQPLAECDGRRKRSTDDEDADFRPSGSSEEQSNLSEEEEEENESSVSESDSSWMCVARQQRRRNGGSRKNTRRSKSRTRCPRSATRRRGRPFPRFEQSDDDEMSKDGDATDKGNKSSRRNSIGRARPRRCARAVVSYRESDDQEDEQSRNSEADLDSVVPVRPINRRRLASSSSDEEEREKDYESAKDGDRDGITLDDGDDDDRPPTPVSRITKIGASCRRKALLSSDSEYQPEEEEDNEPSDENEGASTVSESPEPQDTQIDEVTSPDSRRLDKSHVFDQTSEQSDVGSPAALRITESSSPEPPVRPVATAKQLSLPPPNDDQSRDDESVEEDAEDLLPRHAYPPRSTETMATTTSVPVSLSPDLFG